MVDRSVVTRLRLEVGDYKKSAAEAVSATKQIGTAAEEAAKKSRSSQQQQATGMGKFAASVRENEQAWTAAGGAVTAFGAAAATGVGIAVKSYADFDAQMSAVQAATHETTDNMETLRGAAMKAGADTAFSAVEAAQGIEELAKAGVSTEDIIGGGLAGALDLAAAGSLSVAEAAETTASALTQFKLEGDQATHVADLLAAGAGKAQGSVHDLGAALNQSGLVADQTGLSIEETTGALAMFASAGLVGSDAGTSFKTMLQSLTPSSEEAATLMDELGISAYDAGGNFIGMSEFAGVLQGALSGMSAEQQNATLKTIFGSDAVRAAALVMQQGATGVEAWEAKVNDAGYAAETAGLMTDNLTGDLERLGGAWDTLMIRMGEGANGPFRSVVQSAESFLDTLGELPQPVLNVATGFGGMAAAAGLAVGGFLLLAPRVFDVVKGFQDLNDKHPKVTSGLGKVAKAAGLVTAAFGAVQLISGFVQGLEDAHMGAEELASTLDRLARSEDVIGDTFGDIFKPDDIARGEDFRNLLLDIADPGMADSFNEWSAGILGMETGFGKTADRLSQVGDRLAVLTENSLPDAQKQFGAFWQEAGGDEAAAQALLDTMPAYRDALFGVAEGLGLATDETTILQLATGELGGDMEATAEQIDISTDAADRQVVTLSDLLEIQRDIADVHMTAAEAQAAWAQQTLDNSDAIRELTGYVNEAGEWVKGLGSAVKDGGAELDLFTEAGQLASQTLIDTAEAGWANVEAAQAQGASTEDLKAKTQTARDEFIRVATQMGLNEDAARALADQYGLVPDRIQTDVELRKAQAEADLRTLKEKILGLPDGVVSISTVGYAQTYQYLQNLQGIANALRSTPVRIATGAGGSGGLTFADGGYTGDGGKYEPKGIVHAGEWVTTKERTAQYRPVLESIHEGTFPRLPGYVSGGLVGALPGYAGGGPVYGAFQSAVSVPSVSVGASPVSLVAYVQNPWTGEQVRAVVRTEARSEIEGHDQQSARDLQGRRRGTR